MIVRFCLFAALASSFAAAGTQKERKEALTPIKVGRFLVDDSERQLGAYNRNNCDDATFANNYTTTYAFTLPYTYLSENGISSCGDRTDSYDSGCPQDFGSVNGPLWFYVVGQGRSVRAHSTTSNYDTRVSVYRGTSCSSLQCLGYNDDHDGNQHSSVTWFAEQGVRYYVRLDDYPCDLFDTLDSGYDARARLKFDLLGSSPTTPTPAPQNQPTPAPTPANDFDRICGAGKPAGEIANFVYSGNPPAGVTCACVNDSGENNGYSAACSGEQVTLNGVLYNKKHLISFSQSTGEYRGSVTTLRCADTSSTCASVADRAILNIYNSTANDHSCVVADIEENIGSGCSCEFCGNGGVSYSCFGGSNGCQEAGVFTSNPFVVGSGGGGGSSGVSVGVIVGAAVGGLVVIVGCVVGIWCCVKAQKKGDDSDDYDDNSDGKPVDEEQPGSDTSPVKEEPEFVVEDVPVDDDEDLPPAFSPGNAPNTMRLTVTAPAGPLGLTMGKRGPNGGHLVDVVKATSPMLGIVQEGDEVLKLNSIDLTAMDMKGMTETLRKYAGDTRDLTLVRSMPDLDC